MTWLRTVFNFCLAVVALSSPVFKMNSYWVGDDVLDGVLSGTSRRFGRVGVAASPCPSGDVEAEKE
jgi:hypothetical protein